MKIQIFILTIFLAFSKESDKNNRQEINLIRNGKSVQINYDVNGVPTITGDTYLEVMYGLGYTHSQDRLWQLHGRRSIASGKMASFLGDEWLENDKYMRNLGIMQSARRIVQNMDQESKDLLQSYADGINYGVTQLTSLPIEFQVFKTDFPEWTVLDSIAFIKYFSFLTSDIYSELTRYQMSFVYPKNITALLSGIGQSNQYHPEISIITNLELQNISDLYQEYQEYQEYENFQISENQQNEEFDETYDPDFELNEINQKMGGSNSWVISGNLSDTGYPIVANDPHLENSMPSFWYLANLVMKDNYIKGGSVPGLPLFLNGRSKKNSWSSTILYYDNLDLYEENLQQVDGKYEYLYKDQWLPCEEFLEEIYSLGVKKTFVFKKTQHGPVMENFYDKKNNKIIRFPATFSIKGTYQEDDYCIFMALLKYQLGDDFKAGLEGLKCIISSNSGMIFANEKDIGFVPVGKQIIRTGNPDQYGIPKKGWTGEVEWVRYLTAEEHPIVINPEKGYIISSNQRLFTKNNKYYLSHNVYSTARAHRIDVLIRQLGKNISLSDNINIQLDLVDQQAKETIQVLVQYLDWTDSKQKQFIDIIGKWDFKYTLESTEATLYSIFEQYYAETFQQLTQGWKKGYDFDSFFFKNLLGFSYNEPWCANTKQSTTPCLDNLRNSVVQAMDFYEKLTDKTWKSQHQQYFPHSIFEDQFDGQYNRKIPHVGCRRCVSTSKTQNAPFSFLGVGGPNLRTVISMKPGDEAYFMIDTGQSGDPISSHYDDLMLKWNKDEYITIGTSSQEIQ
ncbi:hypothetical protein pb186bvf_013100 [Paramecium bursaria]